jgi:transmembrane sensor
VIATEGPALAPRIENVAPAVVRETLAWQAPRLAFADTPLADVVEQFNRRNRIQLVIADPEIARRPVGGHFRADYVEAFVRLLETTRDISVERPDADHIVLRKAR